ncbi:MAG: hypothetical protein HY983_04420 [Candidatus Magasanikbacteria bacterium]|nr:hypothetical protein [Candidatus Magasanikbacteria bacterium]
MSIKLRLKYRYRSVRQFVASVSMPAWIWTGSTKGAVAVLIAVVGIGYMFQTNTIGTSGYVVQTLEQQIATVNDETRKLNSELATAESLANIKERLKGLGGDMAMVAASDVQYLRRRSLEKTALAR